MSTLSPWIRRRLISEEEIVAAVIRRHGNAASEKFIQEVFWRSYWRGWLEMRPGLFIQYEAQRKALRQAWAGDTGLRRAIEGRTGIECFDAWTRELVEIGWLHNHARMWFASIWIFTLSLPWQLGADFFFEHLLDGDPASNTLSWRWVAGLHTKGKHYLARAANIQANTLGRFNPLGQLDEAAAALTEEVATPAPAPAPAGDRVMARRVAILLTDEDLHPESWRLEAADVSCCAGLVSLAFDAADRRPAARFGAGAREDGLTRAVARFGGKGEMLTAAEVAHWAGCLGVEEVVTAFAPTGPTAALLAEIGRRLQEQHIRLVRLQREFDARTWPLATAGFFKLKEKIPQLIADFA